MITLAEDNDYFTSGGLNGQRSTDAVWVCWAAATYRLTEADRGFIILVLFYVVFFFRRIDVSSVSA